MKILIVEDDAATRQILEYFCRQRKEVECTTTSSLHEAIDLLKKVKFDCILMDLFLDEGLGVFIIDKAQHYYKSSSLPKIIVLSALFKAEEVVKGYPIKKFIKKPFDIEELENAIFSS